MRSRTVWSLIVAAAVGATPVAARAQLANFTIEGFGGYQNLQLSTGSVSNAVSGNEGTAIVGGDILAGIGGFGVGVLVDKVVSGNGGQPWTGSVLAGILIPITVVRLEVLGELGRRAGSFDDIFKSGGQTIVGVRPGVSFRIPETALVIGAAGIVRWPTSGGDFGSPDYGIVARLGFGFF